jgi:hypothetical protein
MKNLFRQLPPDQRFLNAGILAIGRECQNHHSGLLMRDRNMTNIQSRFPGPRITITTIIGDQSRTKLTLHEPNTCYEPSAVRSPAQKQKWMQGGTLTISKYRILTGRARIQVKKNKRA